MEVPKSWSEDQSCVVTVVIGLAPSVGRRIRIIRQPELADIEKCCEAQSVRQCLWQQMGRIWARLWQSCFQMSLSRYFWYWWRSADAIGQDNLPSHGQHFSSCSYGVFFSQLKNTRQSFFSSLLQCLDRVTMWPLTEYWMYRSLKKSLLYVTQPWWVERHYGTLTYIN